jgi:hypothetical protein
VACEEQHPNNRLLFKRLCAAAGIELGKDNIASALDKVNRRVEILSDALAESRREVAALKDVPETNFGNMAAPVQQGPVAWLIPGSITTDPELAKANGDKAVALGKISTQQWNPEDHYKDGWRDALESVKRATPFSAREWVGLTDDDYVEMGISLSLPFWQYKAIEAKLKEKNNG